MSSSSNSRSSGSGSRVDEADAISYGRLYIANPDLAERLAANAPLEYKPLLML